MKKTGLDYEEETCYAGCLATHQRAAASFMLPRVAAPGSGSAAGVDAAKTATGFGARAAAVVPAGDNACGAAGRAAVATRRSESITAEQA